GGVSQKTTRGKCSSSFSHRRHAGREGTSLSQTIALIAREKEYFVFNYWPAHICAKLVLSKRRNRQSGSGREIVVGVKNFVAQEFICGTVEGVRSRFRG